MMNTLPGFIQLPTLLNNIIGFTILIIGALLGVGVVGIVIFTFLEIRKKLTGRVFTGDNYLLFQMALAVGGVIGGILGHSLAKWLEFVNF